MRILSLAAAICVLCSGCAPLLERTYSTSEPHSSKFWESEAAGTLRAESYQDIVNDLLLLIGQHREAATLRLYDFEDDLSVADALERAAAEVQQETPMGSYAVEYITSTSQSQRAYYEVAVQISYRRTLEQIQSVVNATSPEALYSLLDSALNDGKSELAVRLGYWGEDGQSKVGDSMAQLREERGMTEEDLPWVVCCYPSAEDVGLIEFLLDGPARDEALEKAALAQQALEPDSDTPPEDTSPPENDANGESTEFPEPPELHEEEPPTGSPEPENPEPPIEPPPSEQADFTGQHFILHSPLSIVN